MLKPGGPIITLTQNGNLIINLFMMILRIGFHLQVSLKDIHEMHNFKSIEVEG